MLREIAGMYQRSVLREHSQPFVVDNRPVGPLLWLPLLAMSTCAVIIFYSQGMSIKAQALSAVPQAVCVAAIALYLQCQGRCGRLAGFFVYNNYLGLIGFSGFVAAYSVGTLQMPLADPWLLAIDQGLGYDWRSYATFFVSYPTAAAIILPGYELAYLLPTLTILTFVLIGLTREVEEYVLAMLLATLLTILLFCLFPGRTAWGAAAVPLDEIRALKHLPLPHEGWEADLMNLRNGTLRTLGTGGGIVAFPSLHCATALIGMWAARPLQLLRWPLWAVWITTLLSTPIVGGHYFADMIGGLIVAVLAAFGAAKLRNGLLACKSTRARDLFRLEALRDDPSGRTSVRLPVEIAVHPSRNLPHPDCGQDLKRSSFKIGA